MTAKPSGIDWVKMLELAAAVGVTPATFWAMTPAETFLYIDSHLSRRRRELISQAYLTARLIRAKRFPPLAQVMGQPAARPLKGDELERRRDEFKTMTDKLKAIDLSKVKPK